MEGMRAQTCWRCGGAGALDPWEEGWPTPEEARESGLVWVSPDEYDWTCPVCEGKGWVEEPVECEEEGNEGDLPW